MSDPTQIESLVIEVENAFKKAAREDGIPLAIELLAVLNRVGMRLSLYQASYAELVEHPVENPYDPAEHVLRLRALESMGEKLRPFVSEKVLQLDRVRERFQEMALVSYHRRHGQKETSP